jgi:hypothetical protein
MQLKTSLRYLLEDRWDDKIARGLDQFQLFLREKETGLRVLTGSTESATVGNLTIQRAQLDGSYTHEVGVTANAVAEWASLLSQQPIAALAIEASGNTLVLNKVKEVQRPTGKALA